MTVAATLGSEIGAELPSDRYPGLRPFEPSEWAIFFGRESMIDEVIARLAKQHLMIVHGAAASPRSFAPRVPLARPRLRPQRQGLDGGHCAPERRPLTHNRGRARQENSFPPGSGSQPPAWQPGRGQNGAYSLVAPASEEAQTIRSEVLSGLRTSSARTIPRWMRP